MSFELREASPEELVEVDHVWNEVYRGGRASETALRPEPGTLRFGGRLDGEMVFACESIDFELTRTGTETVRTAGIAAVGTLPEARNRGFAQLAMAQLIRELASRGYSHSALYPFRETFYGKFGYARCGWRWQIRCPVDRFPRLEQTLDVKVLGPSDWQLLDPCHRAFLAQGSGGCFRSAELWRRRFGERTKKVFAFAGSGEVESYFWYQAPTWWDKVEVGEFVWSTWRGYVSALAFMRGLMSNQRSIEWCEPPDSPFASLYSDQGVEFSRNRPTMYRILDVPTCLSRLAGDGPPFEIEVTDHQIDTNSGVWRLSPGREGTQVEKGTKPGLKMGISTLTQLFWGAVSLREAHATGLLEDLGGMTAAEKLFAPSQVCLLEFF